jgi:hypothetical protein
MGLDTRQILNRIQKVSNANNHHFDLQHILDVLLAGKIELQGLIPWSSNYTFLVNLICSSDRTELLAVYKPCRGERPLWDFPEGTLCQREFATYLVSQVLGWPRIPPVVLRSNGPHGQGSVQLFIEADFEAHYFSLRHLTAFAEDFKQVALFDYVVNNADRKGGHCLKGKDGQIWAIDHGLTFHTAHKLRTVIWEFSNEALPPKLLKDLERLQALLDEPAELCQILAQIISPAEIKAFRRRIDRALTTARFPKLGPGHNMPYPPI